MSAFLPSTRVTVLRWSGTAADGQGAADGADLWGDPTDASATVSGPAGENTTVATGLPAAVAEDRQRSYIASEQRGGIVEYLTVRLRPGTDVREGDRLLDERSGQFYLVDAVSNPAGVTTLADVRTTCRKTAATSAP